MTQPNESVFYDADGIFISQYRFVTPDGSVYPTRTIQRVWRSVDWKPLSGCLLTFLVTMMVVGYPAAIWWGFILAFLREELSSPAWYACLIISGLFVVAMLILPTVYLILALGFKIGRRRRYWANFMLAGGGTFTGSSATSVSYPSPFVGGQVRTRSRSERQPDYATWSHDEDWTRNLIAAANEALVAAQA